MIDRRGFLKTGAAGAVAISALRGFAEDAPGASPYGPFKMGMQTYSVRNWKSFDDVLAKAKELGINHLEFWNQHLPATADAAKIAEYKAKLADAKISPTAWGVVDFKGDVKANRTLFEFASAMGIYNISAAFKADAMLSLDRLCEEFPGVHVGIHNHGPSYYPKAEEVLELVKDHHKNIGATADLGHYIRSKQDPLEVIEKLKDRLYGVHFKDFKLEGGEKETIPGDGMLKVKETLAALKKCNFQGCLSLEYESNPKDPIPDMKKALERIQAAVKEI